MDKIGKDLLYKIEVNGSTCLFDDTSLFEYAVETWSDNIGTDSLKISIVPKVETSQANVKAAYETCAGIALSVAREYQKDGFDEGTTAAELIYNLITKAREDYRES